MGIPRTEYYSEDKRIIALEKQIVALKKRLHNAEEACRSSKRQKDRYHTSYQDRIEKLQADKCSLNNKNNQLQDAYNSLLKENKALLKLSATDQLTGLLNRRRVEEILQEESKRMRRYHTALSIILLDVDHFKSVNDQYGHLVGDKVLIEIASLLKQHIRQHDAVARWGGEEFLIVLPFTQGKKAFQVAEKLRLFIMRHDFPEVGKLSSSFGVAEYQAYEDVQSLMHHADKALYQAKCDRNSCMLYTA